MSTLAVDDAVHLDDLPGAPRLVTLAHDPSQPEWHAARQDALTASDAGAILGVDPYWTPLHVYAQKTGLIPIQREESEAMAWGTRLESIIAEWAAEHQQARLVAKPGVLAHRELDWLRCTPDGLLAHPDHTDGLEVKASGDTQRWQAQPVPAAIHAQALVLLAITGLERCIIAVLLGGNHAETRIVERDQRLEQAVLERLAGFWDQLRRRDPPPPGSSRAAARLLGAYPAEPGETISLDSEWRLRLTRRVDLVAEQKTLEREQRELDNELRLTMGPATEAYLDGERVATLRPHQRRDVDTAALRAQEPEIAERFTRTTTIRPLRIDTAAGEEEA